MLGLLPLVLALATPLKAAPIPDPGHSLLAGTFGTATKCLAVRGGVLANGTPVEITDCQSSQTQSWVVTHGQSGLVRVAGTNYCLDAGTDPRNGQKVKIWTCYPDAHLPQQTWYWTNDNRLAVTGRGLCLDNTDGKYVSGNQAQVWQCSDGNTNQVWGAPDRGPCGPFACTSWPFPGPTPTVTYRR